MTPTIRSGWASYSERVLSPKAGEVQVNETHAAFNAGAYFALYALIAGATVKELRDEIEAQLPGIADAMARHQRS